LLAFFLCPHLPIAPRCPGSECPSRARALSISSLVRPSALSSKYVPLVRSLSFLVLTCPLLCALQLVSAPRSLTFFPCSHLSLADALQLVSTPCSLAFFLCSHLSVALPSPGSECPCSLAFFPCPHLSVALRSPASECLSPAHYLSLSSLLRRSAPYSW
jgi:hypothetical protein